MPSPRLWIVATPIGNAEDLSQRARSVLQQADLILAEDTRRAAKLLASQDIVPQKMLSFFEHNEEQRQNEVIAALKAGATVALITDAGTPLLADPGYRLTRACRQIGLPVSPVPGPSAPIAALSAAGIAPIPFTFLGFLPRSASGRRELFEIYHLVPGSLVFFERKNRLSESLELARQILGNREAAICRELTKTHEEFIITNLADAATAAAGLLGEITVIIGPVEKPAKMDEGEVTALLHAAIERGLKPRHAAREVKPHASGWNVSELYSLIQSFRET